MIKVWGRATSSNVQKVVWLAEEIGLPYERIDIGGPFGGNHEPAYRALNPNGLVPTLQDGEFTLWESNSICRYLANVHQAHRWYPTQHRARADVERWMDWSISRLAPSLVPGFWGLIRTAPDERDPDAIRASGEKVADDLLVMESALASHPWLCGDTPTLAEITLGMHVYRWFNLPWDQVGFTPPARERVRGWYQRLATRVPFARVVMIPIV